MNRLAWNYMEQHRYREAESLFREALPISRRVLGDKHGNTCGIVMNLAGLAALQGKRDAAFATLQEAIAVYDLGHWPQVDGVGSDDDFKSLHGDPRWDALLAQLRRITAAK